MEGQIYDLMSFLDEAPTAWHAVEVIRERLLEEGFQELFEEERWTLRPKGKYFTIRDGSSICAFILPQKTPECIRLAASHTDSPGFKLKPKSEFRKDNMVMLGLEVYGAPLWGSWLNRDLGIAGRAAFLDSKGNILQKLVKVEDVPVVIPQLAIHLDRKVNEEGLKLNAQEHLAAIAMVDSKPAKKKKKGFLQQVLDDKAGKTELLSHELLLYPLERARFLGKEGEMIASYRLDSLASVHAALCGFLQKRKIPTKTIQMAAFWDSEEVGSNTAQGAGSPFLSQTTERIVNLLGLDREGYFRLTRNSLCASVDLSHSVHPNYPDKHEPRHPILLNEGIVIKSNAQQRYATNSLTSGRITAICKKKKIPYQLSVGRGDLPCGSTIGPIHATLTGMPTVDIGVAQLSMHSCRELIGTRDHLDMIRFLTAFFDYP